MKKITALLLVVMMLVSAFSMSAFAAVDMYNEDCATIVKETVLKGTPTIDGKLDTIYTQSMTVKLHGPADAYHLQGGAEDITATATAYALYDNNYVYIFFDVVDKTLMQADPEYVQDHPHPHLNDAVEFRVGDDLEDHFAPYDGSNDAHHLFYVDAHGDRFTCYEESMGDDVEKMKSKVITDTAAGKYTAEVAIPVQKAFKEGEMIQFNFQIDDLQNDMGMMAAVGFAPSPTALVDLYCGGPVDGYVETNEEPKVEEPKAEEPKVEEPKVEEPKVEEPKVEEPKVEEPKVEEPKVEEPKVEEPAVDEPAVDEPAVDEPAVDEPAVDEPAVDEPAVDEPVVDEPAVDEPAVDEPVVDEPAVDEPAVEEPAEEEGSNLGLIIGIVVAVIVVVAVVVVVAKKKK